MRRTAKAAREAHANCADVASAEHVGRDTIYRRCADRVCVRRYVPNICLRASVAAWYPHIPCTNVESLHRRRDPSVPMREARSDCRS